MELILLYLIVINAAGFALMLVDKYQARKNLWRIPESTLITVCAIGGSLGCLVGMYAVRHKKEGHRPSFPIIPISFLPS